MRDPRPIPEPLMVAMRRDRRMRRAKDGEINGDDVHILLRKPGREPYAMHFTMGPEGRDVIDAYCLDYARFLKMVHDGTASRDLRAENALLSDDGPDLSRPRVPEGKRRAGAAAPGAEPGLPSACLCGCSMVQNQRINLFINRL